MNICLIPDVGRSRLVKPRTARNVADCAAVGEHEARMFMSQYPAITEVEVVVFRPDTREAVDHAIVRKDDLHATV